MWKLLVLDRNIWYLMTVRKQIIIIMIEKKYVSYATSKMRNKVNFLAEYKWFEFRAFFLGDWPPQQGWRASSDLLFTRCWWENNLIHEFSKDISVKWNANSCVQNLNSGRLILPLPLNHHHHHVVPPARISLTLSRHFSLSFIASGRSSGLHPVSSHSCCM